MAVLADALSVEDPAVRLLDSVTCHWNPEEPNGGIGHRCDCRLSRFIARKRPV